MATVKKLESKSGRNLWGVMAGTVIIGLVEKLRDTRCTRHPFKAYTVGPAGEKPVGHWWPGSAPADDGRGYPNRSNVGGLAEAAVAVEDAFLRSVRTAHP